MVNIYQAFRNICLRQRVTADAMSIENFRKTLIQLIQDASEDELINLAIDVENDALGYSNEKEIGQFPCPISSLPPPISGPEKRF